MDKQTNCKASERGVALILALLAILVLSILAAAIMTTSQAQTWTALNYRLTAQSRYSAEAGLQSTMNWLSNPANYPAPNFALYNMNTNPVTLVANGQAVVLSATPGVNSTYPDAAVVAAYSAALSQALPGVPNASYSTYATLLRMSASSGASFLTGGGAAVVQTWQITSQGAINNVPNASVQVVETFERTGTPVFGYGIESTGTGCGSLTFAGKDSTDSYNSALGVYGGANVGNQGNVATNGNVSLQGTGGNAAVINGTVGAPNATVGACPDGLTDASAGNHGALTAIPTLNPPLPWGCNSAMPPCYPPGTLVTTAQNVSTACASIAGCTKSGLGYNGTGSVTSLSITDGGSTRTANVFTLQPTFAVSSASQTGPAYGNMTINAADVVHVSAGTYDINSINFALDGQFVVDSGPVVFNIVGNCASGCPTESLPSPMSSTEVIYGAGFAGFNGCSMGVTANPNVYGSTTCGSAKTAYSGIPSNLQVVYGGSYTMRLGGMPNALVLYAPNSGYYTPGAPVGLYGSAVVKNFRDDSGSPFHYDQALANSITQVGPYKPVGGFSWSKF